MRVLHRIVFGADFPAAFFALHGARFFVERGNFCGFLCLRFVVNKIRVVRHQPRMDFLPRLAGSHHFQLAFCGMRLRIGEDFDNLRVFQRLGNRDDFSVRLCAHNFLADRAMHMVGKINRRASGRKLHHITFRREHENFVTKQIAFEFGKECLVAQILFPKMLQLIHYAQVADVHFVVVHAFFVQPVRRNAVFRLVVHVARADLDFQRLSLAHHRGVN